MTHIKEIIVTAGGTREQIDDVRFVGNFSAGRFGVEIANTLAGSLIEPTWGRAMGLEGVNVTLLAPKETTERFDINPYIKRRNFTDVASLGNLLLKHGTHPNLIVHAAAVADYTPTRQAGKIRSDSDELTITMKRTPKLLAELRRSYGPKTFLTGFKLLSDTSRSELVEVGHKQLIDNQLDLTVANSLQDVHPLGRTVIALTKDREDYVIEGSTKSVANRLVDYILELSNQREVDRLSNIPKEPI